MFTFETDNQKEVRRFRIAQFNGRTATVTSNGSTITGHVRSVVESKSSVPARWSITLIPAEPKVVDRRAAPCTARSDVCGRYLLSASSGAVDRRRYTGSRCSSALRTRSAVLRAPSLRIASARWLSNVRGLMFILSAPCLLE